MTRLHVLRRISQIAFVALVFLAPVFDIFRFDSATGTIIFFGSEWGLGLDPSIYLNPAPGHAGEVAWHIFTKALLPWIVILSIFPLLGTLLGRFFCGWFCPEGAMFELFDFLSLRILGRRSMFVRNASDPSVTVRSRLPYIATALLCIVTIPLLSGVMLTGYFIAPATIWKQIFAWEFTFGVKAGIIGVSIYVLLSALVIRHALCKYICGAGLMQTLFGWASPVSLRVGPDQNKINFCTDCRECEKVCFMNVKPRTPRKNINCVNCGECITACRKELGEDKAIFSFVKNRDFGTAGKREDTGTGCRKLEDLKSPVQKSIIRT